MSNFKPFAAAVAAQFAAMSQHELYVTKIDGDVVYAAYLAAFPEGTNPKFRERTEHDCSCCKNFIRNIGNVVAIIDGKVVTVWDTLATNINVDMPYRVVAEQLAAMVALSPIDTIFRTAENRYGAVMNKGMAPDGTVETWHHFHGTIAARHYTKDVGTQVGEFNAAKDVFTRGLKELTSEALDTVLELINENQLYRGDEHKSAVVGFMQLHAKYHLGLKLAPANANNFIIANALNRHSRFRNTVIGTLVIDLSNGENEERAIKSFEQKVAPTNYKRPTALVTEAMKKQAMATITELGLEDSLVRRLASPADVTINNVLWADGAVKATMKDGIAGIMDTIITGGRGATQAKVADISIADFLSTVLPTAKSIDMLVRNRHMTNFMAITTGSQPSSGDLFKWGNPFAWTYTGNISDSIKERVKAAGGATDAVLRVSLAWHNGDDLDLHAFEPKGHHIYFATRSCKSPVNKGMLDVDMNAGYTVNNKDPVENIIWEAPTDGEYRIDVNNYNLRDKSNFGYTLEVENNGQVQQFTSAQSPSDSRTHNALILTVKDRVIVSIKTMKEITGGSFSQEKWGIATETPVRVNMVMYSPNHWDDHAVGNKHFMFILEGCKTDEPLRGILNEYLNPKLEAHRKVFEVLGDKTKCQPTEQQLAGLGFSNTKGDSVMVNVTADSRSRTYNIIF